MESRCDMWSDAVGMSWDVAVWRGVGGAFATPESLTYAGVLGEPFPKKQFLRPNKKKAVDLRVSQLKGVACVKAQGRKEFQMFKAWGGGVRLARQLGPQGIQSFMDPELPN